MTTDKQIIQMFFESIKYDFHEGTWADICKRVREDYDYTKRKRGHKSASIRLMLMIASLNEDPEKFLWEMLRKESDLSELNEILRKRYCLWRKAHDKEGRESQGLRDMWIKDIRSDFLSPIDLRYKDRGEKSNELFAQAREWLDNLPKNEKEEYDN